MPKFDEYKVVLQLQKAMMVHEKVVSLSHLPVSPLGVLSLEDPPLPRHYSLSLLCMIVIVLLAHNFRSLPLPLCHAVCCCVIIILLIYYASFARHVLPRMIVRL